MIYGTIVAVGTGFVAVAGTLNKLKVIRIPFRRTNNQFSGMSIQQIEACVHRHDLVENRLDGMDKIQTRQEVCIENTKNRLDKGEERFEKFQEDMGNIKTNVAVIKETMNQQYGFMTDSMQLILKKIG